ncbi:MAG: hypothetical protein JWP92_1683, partial [Caulobacter sp.]|nr:hypothetical protein [Caulobacter sp.]
LLWVGLTLGGALGAAAYLRVGALALWAAAAGVAALAVGQAVGERRASASAIGGNAP